MFRVIAPDFIGFGKSDKFVDYRAYNVRETIFNNFQQIVSHPKIRTTFISVAKTRNQYLLEVPGRSI